MTNLLEENEWQGEFFVPGSYERRFYGAIHFSPENGLLFDYTIIGFEVPPRSPVLHGVLSSGEKCTLMGSFAPEKAGTAFKDGQVSRPGLVGLKAMIVGDFFDPDQNFSTVSFTLTNLQEFFYPSGFKDLVKFCAEPIYSLNTSFGKISVSNTAKFSSFRGGDVGALIYSSDDNALADLAKAITKVEKNYPDAGFMLKKDISYRVVIDFLTPIDVSEIFSYISSFSNLFALLIYSPSHPDNVQLIKNNEDGLPRSFELIPSIILDKRTIEMSKKDHFHWHMPIKQSNIPFDEIVSEWFENRLDNSPAVSSIQHETGFRNIHAAHGELVLYATHLESISYKADQKRKKYQYPIEEFLSEVVRSILMDTFGVGSVGEIGKAIGDLRNEIAHIGRPIYWLNKLSLKDLIKISQCLHLTIVGHMLLEIGVARSVVNGYQELHSPSK